MTLNSVLRCACCARVCCARVCCACVLQARHARPSADDRGGAQGPAQVASEALGRECRHVRSQGALPTHTHTQQTADSLPALPTADFGPLSVQTVGNVGRRRVYVLCMCCAGSKSRTLSRCASPHARTSVSSIASRRSWRPSISMKEAAPRRRCVGLERPPPLANPLFALPILSHLAHALSHSVAPVDHLGLCAAVGRQDRAPAQGEGRGRHL